jgi:molybdenum cofactor guanylyltransferase
MGGAKAAVELDGRPLISYAIAAVEKAGLEPIVVAKPDSELPSLQCRTLEEPPRPSHPASGLVAALRGSNGRALIAVACDMPFLSPGLLAWLAGATEPLVLAELDGQLQPFPGRYDTQLLPQLEARLGVGEPLRRTLAELRPRRVRSDELVGFGPPQRWAFNVNTRADLARAERLLHASDG